MLIDPGDDEPGSASSTPSHHDDALSRLVGAPADPAARVAAHAAIALVVPGAAAFKLIEDRAEQVRSDTLERFENAAAADKGRALQGFRWAADLAVELDNVCARGYSAAGDWAGAERCWLSALWVVDHDFDDVDRWLHYLHQLRVNYLRWRRPHKARLTARVQRYLTELAAPRRERTRPAGSAARRGTG
jgi:hypothetical protein